MTDKIYLAPRTFYSSILILIWSYEETLFLCLRESSKFSSRIEFFCIKPHREYRRQWRRNEKQKKYISMEEKCVREREYEKISVEAVFRSWQSNTEEAEKIHTEKKK